MQNSVTVQSSPASRLHDGRRHQRYTVEIEIVLHNRGAARPATMNDISAGGVGLEGVLGVYENDRIEIELGDGRRLPGTVVWWISGCCGVEFDHELCDADPLLTAAITATAEA